MQVSKWGNSLAVRLPASVIKVLGLKEGDDIEIHVAGRGAFVSAHQKLIEMKMESNLRKVEIGCTVGPICPLPFVEEAQLREVA